MSKSSWIACAFLAISITNTGCVTHCHRGFQKSLEYGPECDIPADCRNRVHVFMIHGLTPSTNCGLNSLRLKLGENGFAKIGSGEVCNGCWVKSEIDCIRANDPDARFVLLGYDLGGATALSLARDLTAKGVAVEAVVLLDPMGCPTDPSGVRTLLLTSGTSTSRAPHTARVVVPEASHFGLPTHPTTVAAITDLLREIAIQNCLPAVQAIPESTYKYAPDPRPEAKGRIGGDWDFLADRSGPTRPLGTQVVTKPVATPTLPPSPVVLKR